MISLLKEEEEEEDVEMELAGDFGGGEVDVILCLVFSLKLSC